MNENSKKLGTESYKGVRDFYPEDQAVQNFIIHNWKKTLESFGYVEYHASILEPAELYKQKSGEEIINEQTYTFIDRGEREVTLRPEMTPTVARMVAGKKRDLAFPLRWYSVPNLFRYERPQRGRLREHWQLNCDMFGVEGVQAEIEIIKVASKIMENLGATAKDFEIRLNSRKIVNKAFKDAGLTDQEAHAMQKLLDRKNKITDFDAQAEVILGRPYDIEIVPDLEVAEVMETLKNAGISNVVFDPSIMRGFDYYTGIVFEVFDTHPDNNRAMFGGGRYDDLLSLFGGETVPAVGFGMGDVTARDFLEVHNLLPKTATSTHLYLVNAGVDPAHLGNIAAFLREEGINVAIDLSGKKIGDQIKKANRDHVPFVVVVGEEELKSNEFKLKNLATGTETPLSKETIASYIKDTLL